MPLIEAVIVFCAAALSVGVAVFWIARSGAGRGASGPGFDDGMSFLFDSDVLHHASNAALHLHGVRPGRDTWASLRALYLGRFPRFPDSPPTASGEISIRAVHDHDGGRLRISQSGAFTRVVVEEEDQSLDRLAGKDLISTLVELEHLRRASDTTPHPVWQVDAQGKVIWCNAAYSQLYRTLHEREPDRDVPVFADLDAQLAGAAAKRIAIDQPDKPGCDWYDVSVIKAGEVRIFHAVNVNAVVQSEIAQRNFVQTLAKTFAHLSIGLAIFDRKGQLALFNPALIDLTSLPAEFLSARPTLLSFFDRLRENRRMPEPKNYRSWRQEIAEVVTAATDGRYQETWTLESGQTYRVRGRPHPDGAIAFLIEDISAEVSLTRNFRAELKLGQSLMDSFDDALVVFSPAGVLSFCNAAYRKLWKLDPDNAFADVTIADSIAEWKRLCEPGARWAALTDFVLDYGDRDPWSMPVSLRSGEQLTCQVAPIASGATLVRFSTAPEPAAPRRQRKPAGSAAR
ncbi:PAS-domain containing protein [Sulfitobacter sp. D35]|uniref:PAS-domain containing protein n=1 Tax=Sulfitobacter sp. D35 TaxID=3083252 RepID=UPI00296E8010|nr:PAS-domain containing protein [Sulfitobacter sp. D35]MDW4498094.1 PAS-domain containing protein [Sulfitobacter sp. D35]